MSTRFENRESAPESLPGQVWAWLDTERHDLHAALLAEARRVREEVAWALQEELQARLHEVNEALDRLMIDA